MSVVRKAILISLAFPFLWVCVALYFQISEARAISEERRIALQSERTISGALRTFFEAQGYYPVTLDQLALDKRVSGNFRYWTNANGGYSLVWEGKHGFWSSVFTRR